MRKLLMFALIVCVAFSLPAQAARYGKGKKSLTPIVTINPSSISTVSPAPTVCIDGFDAGTYVNVYVPQLNYGFMVIEAGPQCHANSTYVLSLDAGVYDVPSDVCDYAPGSIPSNCRSGPTVTLTVN